MNNKVLIGIVLVVLIALVLYFALANKDDSQNNSATNSETNTTNTQETQNTNQEEANQPRSLSDLLGGSAQTCTYTDGQNTGVVHAANGKARIDGTSTQNGQTVTSHIILDGNMYYMWVDGQSTGFKMTLNSSNSQPTQGTQGQPAQSLDVNKQADYDCQSESADASKFTPPANVQFTDYSSIQVPSM